jgi:hypothetical protein
MVRGVDAATRQPAGGDDRSRPGMLLDVMLGIRASEHRDESRSPADMAVCAFGEEGLSAVAGG